MNGWDAWLLRELVYVLAERVVEMNEVRATTPELVLDRSAPMGLKAATRLALSRLDASISGLPDANPITVGSVWRLRAIEHECTVEAVLPMGEEETVILCTLNIDGVRQWSAPEDVFRRRASFVRGAQDAPGDARGL